MTEPNPDVTQHQLLTAMAETLTDVSNLMVENGLDRELLADALISGGVEVLRRLFGPDVAAERIEYAATVIRDKNAMQKH